MLCEWKFRIGYISQFQIKMLQVREYLHPHKLWKYSEEDDRTGDQEIIEARKG